MTEKQFKVINISENGMKGLFKLGNDNLSVYDVARLLNELLEENEKLKQLLLQFYTEDEKECPLFDELDVLSNEMDMGFRVKLD